MKTDERALFNRDGVFTRDERAMDFRLRRKHKEWKDQYWIDTPDGVNVAHSSELEWDEKGEG